MPRQRRRPASGLLARRPRAGAGAGSEEVRKRWAAKSWLGGAVLAVETGGCGLRWLAVRREDQFDRMRGIDRDPDG